MHKQTWTKVNVQVDTGIKGIVEAFSAFPKLQKLQTIESCEEDQPGSLSLSSLISNHYNILIKKPVTIRPPQLALTFSR